MMRTHSRRGRLACVALLLPTVAAAQGMRSITAARQYHHQERLRARVEFAAGELRLGPGSPGSLYRMQLTYDEARFTPVARYDERSGELVLGLDPIGTGGIRVSSQEHLKQDASIDFNPETILSLDVSLGAVDAELELGGLRVSDARIAAAASRTQVRFSTPNPERCDLLKLNAGAAEFSAYGLGNSRCRRVEFEGGVGAVTLDLTGAWSEDATLTLRLALGELTLRLPENLGVELSCDRFLSRFEPHGFTRTGNVYRSAGFDKAPRRIKVDITSAVGGVNVVWVPAGNP